MYTHIPVLLSEVLEHLQPEPNQRFIDGTVGQGGHAEKILERVLPVVSSKNSSARLLAIDRDAQNLATAQKRLDRFGDAVVFVHDSYAQVKTHALAHGFTNVNGILLDLGFASSQVDNPDRGFSFRNDGPLDMRYDITKGVTAAEIVNTWDEDELARIFRLYGEENKARPVAQAIIAQRAREPFVRTSELAECVARIVHGVPGIHPATRVFQALRIAVNDEFGELQSALPDLVELLAPHGRIAIITFHSLEDRIVKRFFADHPTLQLVNKRVIIPSREEIEKNPRARSAKLRVAQRL
ncbi:MAG: 16S rRNA (cytosine(1402)-N(4))-methyltransferase RsmH [Patescibacteria group bacterium]